MATPESVPDGHISLAVSLWLLSCLFAGLPSSACCWTARSHPTHKTQAKSGEIIVDGDLSDPGWRGLDPLTNFVEHEPGDQIEPPVTTEVMVTYDASHLYVAFICSDDPAKIRASYAERDRVWNDDLVVILLDTFGEQDWAYEIGANPYGIQADILWSSASGDDDAYDLIYDSAGRITTTGWQVEFAIPWTSLRFPDRPQQEWRVDFARFQPRGSRALYSWAKYNRDEPCWPCQWGTLTGIKDVRPGHGLEILPAVVASQTSERQTDDTLSTGHIVGEPSLSVSVGISPTVNAEATLNPDFSQVESDADQIDVNSTFALFFPEKRPFFQEGSDLWDTEFNLVYTRMVNKPAWATKLTGRPGKSSFAVLLAQDETTPFIVPFTENSAMYSSGRSWSSLARYRRTLGEQSHLGLIFTDRQHEGGGAGTTFGADSRWRLSQNTSANIQLVATHTTEPNNPDLTADLTGETFASGRYTATFDGESFWGHGVAAGLQREGRHWNLGLSYQARSATFRAENGFEPRNNQRVGHVSTSYTYYQNSGLLDKITTGVFVGRMWEYSGRRKDEWLGPYARIKLRWAQTSLQFQHVQSNENFQDTQFDHIFVNGVHLTLTPTEAVNGGLNYSAGHRIARHDLTMGHEINYGGYLNLKPHRRLYWENNVRYVRSDALHGGTELFAGYVVRSRFNLQFSREWSLRLVLQYNSFAKSWDADPLLTWRLNPLSIFYVGATRHYGEQTPTQTDLSTPWQLTDRTYFLKLQYLFQL